MTVQDLSMREMSWLTACLSCDFPGKKETIRQLETAAVTREYTPWYLSLKFEPDRSLPPVPTEKRVPVLMLAHIEGRAPLQFMLHIIGGYVSELEILFADSTGISDDIDLTGVELEYILD